MRTNGDSPQVYIPNNVVNATYCNLCKWIGISFAISWWIIGKKGGQFFSSRTIPAEKQRTDQVISCNGKIYDLEYGFIIQ